MGRAISALGKAKMWQTELGQEMFKMESSSEEAERTRMRVELFSMDLTSTERCNLFCSSEVQGSCRDGGIPR